MNFHSTEGLRDALATDRPTFCLGDVNIDALRQDTPICRRYMAVLNDLGLQQLVTEPTHLEPTPSLLDHIITNVDGLNSAVSVPAEQISDHLTTVLHFPFAKPSPQLKSYISRPWHKANWDAICLDLLYINWDPVYQSTDIDTKVNIFMQLLVECSRSPLSAEESDAAAAATLSLGGERWSTFRNHAWEESSL